jgi:hypothetical protein
LNLRTDHAKERNAKDKVLSVSIGWQLEARTGAQHRLQSDSGSAACAQARFARNEAIMAKELSSATHVAETADGGWKPPRLVARPAAAAAPFGGASRSQTVSWKYIRKEIMATFKDKFRDARWISCRDQLLKTAESICEDCDEFSSESQVHICYYPKGLEPWDFPNEAFHVYCPEHRSQREQIETTIRETLARFTSTELDALGRALSHLAAIPLSERGGCAERLYVAAKNEPRNSNLMYDQK